MNNDSSIDGENTQSKTNMMSRVRGFQINHGWQWLIYIDFILPSLIYILALLPLGAFRGQLARIFHSYMLYILYPWPDFQSFTGIVAPLLHLYFLIQGIRKKNKTDIILAVVFWLILTLFFTLKIDGTQLNYYILRFLDFGL